MEFHLAFLAAGMLGGFVCGQLLAAFLASRKWHWFFGFLLLVVLCLPLALADVPELSIVVLLSPLVTFVGVRYAMHRDNTVRERIEQGPDARYADVKTGPLLIAPKFDLASLMLQIFGLSIVFAVTYQLGVDFTFLIFTHLIGISFAIGTWGLFGLAISCWDYSFWKKVLLFSVPMLGTLVWAALDDQWLASGMSSKMSKLILWLVVLLAMATLVVIVSGLTRYAFPRLSGPSRANVAMDLASSQKPSSGRTWFRSLAKVVVVAVFATVATSMTFCFKALMYQPSITREVEQSGLSAEGLGDARNSVYSDLLKVSNQFAGSKILDMSRPVHPGQELRAEVNKYADVFESVHATSKLEFPPWIDWSTGNAVFLDPRNGFDMAILRQAVRALKMKSRQERFEGNHDQSLRDAMTCLELGNVGGPDSIMVMELCNFASQGTGFSEIALSFQDASDEGLAEVAALLRRCDDERNSFEQVVENEKVYATFNLRWKWRIFYAAMLDGMMEPAVEQLREASLRNSNCLKQLRTLIELEKYQRSNGKYPTSLEDLPSEGLESLISDPYSQNNEPFRYKLLDGGTAFKLYSVGADGKDNAGASNGRSAPGLDVDFWQESLREEQEHLEWIDTKVKARQESESLLDGGIPFSFSEPHAGVVS